MPDYLSMLCKAGDPECGTHPHRKLDTCFAVGSWDWRVQCQHSPVFPTAAAAALGPAHLAVLLFVVFGSADP